MATYTFENCECCGGGPCPACPSRSEWPLQVTMQMQYFREIYVFWHAGREDYWDITHWNQTMVLDWAPLQLQPPYIPRWQGEMIVLSPPNNPAGFTRERIIYTVGCNVDPQTGEANIRAVVDTYGEGFGSFFPSWGLYSHITIPTDPMNPYKTCSPLIMWTFDEGWEFFRLQQTGQIPTLYDNPLGLVTE